MAATSGMHLRAVSSYSGSMTKNLVHEDFTFSFYPYSYSR